MTVKLVRELATKAKLYLITLPIAANDWTDVIDVFGFSGIQLLVKDLVIIDFEFQTSGDGIVWGVHEAQQPNQVDGSNNFHSPTRFFGAANGSPLEVPISGPLFRFRAVNVLSRGKTFFLYCL